MSAKAKIIMGEAPESDSEDELNVSDVKAEAALSISKGRVITGEAPESDEETFANSASLNSISSAMSASSLPYGQERRKKPPRKDQSLLSKKLYERNVSLAKNMTEIVNNTVSNANNELNTVDQHILKCQVKVQESADLLKTLLTNVNDLDSRIQSLLSNTYIPDIQIYKKDQSMT